MFIDTPCICSLLVFPQIVKLSSLTALEKEDDDLSTKLGVLTLEQSEALIIFYLIFTNSSWEELSEIVIINFKIIVNTASY